MTNTRRKQKQKLSLHDYLAEIRSLIKRPWFKWPIITASSIISLGFLGFLFILYGGALIVDDEALILPATTTIQTEDGIQVGRVFSENRQLVTLDQIPDHVQAAFIAVEDERFYRHAGVDFRSVMRAVYRDIVAFDKVEGASTITQQLSKNLFLDNSKTWMRKTKEVMASIYLERHYTKNDILELYLNEVYFAHGIHGVGTAADFFFGKSVEDLTVTEGAMLAGLIKGPNRYSPYIDADRALSRRNLVLSQMQRVGELNTEEMLALQGQTLGVQDRRTEDKPWLASYIDVVLREAETTYQLSRDELRRGGYQITVYLDENAQKIAYDELQKTQYFQGSQPNAEAAFTLMEQETGRLKALIGGRQFKIGDHNRVLTQRQPGSVMKPLAVYAPAMTEGYDPYVLLEDSQQDYDGYTVRNADNHYDGEVTMYDAVRVSKNTSAVWLLDQLGINVSKSYLEKMSLELPDEGLALGLGGLKYGLTPIQVAEGYRTFIHDGEWIEAHSIAVIKDRNGNIIGEADPRTETVFSQQAAWNMVRMLENAVVDGTAQAGDFPKALAGKTGTTQHPHVPGHAKDAWFAGVTPEYVTSLWIGYDHSDAEHYLTTGSQSPTMATKAILEAIDQVTPLATAFEKPVDVMELSEPIRLPVVHDLNASFSFGGWTLVRGKLDWTADADDRIVYHIYQKTETGDQLIGKTEGIGEFTLTGMSLFGSSQYFVVPYNPLTKQTGQPSNVVTLSLRGQEF
ncbi:penicillin-binding protein 2A [Natronobacillus azotifigens]|uniref:PBP1A family penicillin-binding protein n=1 Tax=Natronobacillus azotifigens TaxID=472978 RepID=A0A9J6RC72_9BACI|nr:PBP1A family penicillin-binding protein [Natronobacillus azotifigens]MCZ0703298.1 PBP1A family penicillin-binding protein [Natronobacillus azotifigens]